MSTSALKTPAALLLLTLLALTTPAVTTVHATEDQDNATPTAALWFYGQTEANISSTINAGYRLVDLEVESTASPVKFSAAFVKNSGSYAQTFWWYYNISLATVGTLVSQNNGRLVDIEPYEVNGVVRYAVVMVSNTGANSKSWWYYSSPNLNTISNALTTNNARIVDLEEQTLLGQTVYTAVMIKNTGADSKPWYWWLGASTSFLSNEIASKNLRLVDLERRSDGTFNAVLVKNTENMQWFWWAGISPASLNAKLAQNGTRVQSIQRVNSGGLPFFYAICHNNTNALTTRVGNILRNGTDGVSGLFLKEINGGVRASLQQDFAFEPASTIKTLMHVHAMRAVEQSSASLGEALTVWQGLGGPGVSNSCPQYTNPTTEGMSSVLFQMMFNSDNNRTMAIRDRFGAGNINATAAQLGMNDTQIIHTLGCGGPPPNSLSLSDGSLLHEAVANGYLGSQRQQFYDLMRTNVPGFGGNQLGAIIDQEAAALGLSSFVTADFKSLMEMAYKGGSYGYGTPLDYYYSVLSWVKIPFIFSGELTPREYVAGIFIHDGSSNSAAGNTLDDASAELLRDEIRAALVSWKAVDNSWANLGGGLAGTNGALQLLGSGSLVEGTAVTSTLSNALAFAPASLILGYTFINAPFKGGIWGPFPDIVIAGISTNSQGSISLPGTWPSGTPSGFQFYVQWWMHDAGALNGFAGSNTLQGSVP
ncbi:MAG: hypothetical protein ACI9EF_001895 [Pseudohongiellaceae bacterium]|jgi:hypothetical protein